MAKRPKPVPQMTAAQFDAAFPDEEACKAYLVARRWPDGVHCPRCGNPKVYDLKSRQWHWQCERCASDGYRFSHIAGTIFENTNKPLRDWFKVAHLMLASKKGMSALQIMRYMGFGSYKTAWGMCHKIRTALIEDIQKLGGIVEVDESPSLAAKTKTNIGTVASVARASIVFRPKLRSSARSSARATSSLAYLTISLAKPRKPLCAKRSPTRSVRSPLTKAASMKDWPNTITKRSITTASNTLSAPSTRIRSRASGRSSSAVSSALSTK